MNQAPFAKHLATLLAVVGAITSAAALAQLEEVVVTAQKREQSLQDVPIAVSAFSATTLEEAGVTTVADLAQLVPALEVQGSDSVVASSFRIRRVGNFGNIPDFEPAVAVFIDGAFRSRSVFGATELFDLERVEVLRGPQGTLYGKNSTAGVIGIYTAKPAEEMQLRGALTGGVIEGGAGDAAMYDFTGGISGPLTDTLGASLGLSYAYNEHLQDEAIVGGAPDSNQLDRYSLRGQLNWQASDRLSLRAIAGVVQQPNNDAISNDYYYDPQGYIAGFVLPTLQEAGVSQVCTDNDPKNHTGCNRRPVETDLDASDATLLLTYAMDNGWTIDSITSGDYLKFKGTQEDAAQIMAPVLIFQDTQENTAWQQELRLTSAGGETLDWMTGLFFYDATFKRGDDGNRPLFRYDSLSDDPTVAAVNQALLETPFPLPFATRGQVGYLDSRQDTEYLAMFGQLTWAVTDAFSVTGGARWQREEKRADIYQSVNDPSPSLISLLLSPAEVSAGNLSRDPDEVTWSLSPQWFLSDGTMLYLAASHGWKSGGYNTGFGALSIADREFQDEDVMNYEGGVKAQLLDDSLRLSLSAFYTEYEHYQDAAFVGGQFTVGNAQKATTQGVEAESTLLLGPHFTVDAAVSYADFKYDEYSNGQCYPGREPDSPADPTACDLSGEHPIDAPEWKTHLGIVYTLPVRFGELYSRLDWSWTDDYNTTTSADPRWVQSSYSWTNLRLGARWADYDLALWAENLADAQVATIEGVANIYTGDNSVQSYLAQPRSYGITLRADF